MPEGSFPPYFLLVKTSKTRFFPTWILKKPVYSKTGLRKNRFWEKNGFKKTDFEKTSKNYENK